MSFKKFKNLSTNTYKIALGVLLAVVIIETLFLVRTFFNDQSVKKIHQQVIPAAKKEIQKVPAKKAIKVVSAAPVGRPQAAGERVTLGKIAIIVDDSGYNIRDCDHLQAIHTPLTISILPSLKHSMDIAQCAHAYQKEVMLHLPLEPHENSEQYPQDYIIKTEMAKGQILDRLAESLRSVPHAQGINNHMGSKATENKRLMSIIFDEMSDKNLFFVDSRVTAKTVCPQLARETGLPFAQRDVFLDNVNRRPEIEQQFAELARLAQKHGSAIGIGHARQLTWEIIKEQTKKLTQDGFEIVPVKTIINKN